MPKISVIIPTYNRAEMIMVAVASVIKQTYSDWEAIVVDDGSQDDTQKIITGLQENRIQYVFQQNKGLPGARNTGIRCSDSEYIAFLDSDDAFLPDKLAKQVEMLDARPELGLAAAGFYEVDDNFRELRELRPWEQQPTLSVRDWVVSCPFCPGASLVRRSWLEQVGYFDESMRYVEDWDLWLRMAYQGCQMDWLKEPVCYYRIHGGNMVRQAILMKDGMIHMFDKFFSIPDMPSEIHSLRGQAYGVAYVNAAARALAAGDGSESRNCLEYAIEYDPETVSGNPPRLLSSLASFALTPLCPNDENFFSLLAENLPETFSGWSREKVFSVLYAVKAFTSASHQDSMSVLRNANKCIRSNPKLLTNRGFLKIIAHALFGGKKRLLIHSTNPLQ